MPGLPALLASGMNISMSDGANHSGPPTSTIVGIDEAGYGPLLGPLVVTAAAFDVPVEIMKRARSDAEGPDLWQLLSSSVTRKVSKRDARLAVADSKKLFQRSKSGEDLSALERAVLTFLAQTDQTPSGWRALLNMVAPFADEKLRHYPWYRDGDLALPTCCRPDDLATQRNALRADMADKGIRFRGFWSEVLPEGHYNQLVTNTRNKAVVLFGLTARLIQRVADSVGPRPLRVWIDRQGGRIVYRRPLMTAFEDAQLDVLEESPERSSYRLTRRPAPWAVRFVTKGEEHHLPIALASILSKYLRELFMARFNQYWSAHVADLRPTAGYYQDGQRFLTDIAPAITRLQIDRQWLVRAL